MPPSEKQSRTTACFCPGWQFYVLEADQKGLNKVINSGDLSLLNSLGGGYLTQQCDSAYRKGEEASKRSLN